MKELIKTKKNLAILVGIALMVIIIPITIFQVQKIQENRSHASAEAVAITLSPLQKSIKTGENVDIGVSINGGQSDISAVDITFTFDKSLLLYGGPVPECPAGSNDCPSTNTISPFAASSTFTVLLNTVNYDTGTIHFVGINPSTTPITGTKDLGTFYFRSNGVAGNASVGFTDIHVNAAGVADALPINTDQTRGVIFTIGDGAVVTGTPCTTTDGGNTKGSCSAGLICYISGKSACTDSIPSSCSGICITDNNCTPRPACLDSDPPCMIKQDVNSCPRPTPPNVDDAVFSLNGTYKLIGTCTSICTGDWIHQFTITNGSYKDGVFSFTGKGFYVAAPTTTWDITGKINLSGDVTYKLIYTGDNAGYWTEGVGKFAGNGTWQGTSKTSQGQTGTWVISPTDDTVISDPNDLDFRIKIQGIAANKQPLHPIKVAEVNFYNSAGTLTYSQKMNIIYSATNGIFTGRLSTAVMVPGNYTVKIMTAGSLWKQIPGIITVKQDVLRKPIPVTLLIMGDVNGDNEINLRDYVLLISCMNNKDACNIVPQVSPHPYTSPGAMKFDKNIFAKVIN